MGSFDGDNLKSQTIDDFGEQWSNFRANEGYYASVDCLKDIVGPLLDVEEIAGKSVADIGSGTGRIVRWLLDCGARDVLAVEPSAAMEVMRDNLTDAGERVVFLKAFGDMVPQDGSRDYVFSLGVIHHIPDPLPVVKAIRGALKPGGRIVLWLYGREGNGAYLAVARPLRFVTVRMPHVMLSALSWLLAMPLSLYALLCKLLPLPLRAYFNNHISRLSWRNRVLTIYDQLNPAWAKYYTRSEVESLLKEAGFDDINLYHRHGYSWTAIATA